MQGLFKQYGKKEFECKNTVTNRKKDVFMTKLLAKSR